MKSSYAGAGAKLETALGGGRGCDLVDMLRVTLVVLEKNLCFNIVATFFPLAPACYLRVAAFMLTSV